jgi:outer membrane protein
MRRKGILILSLILLACSLSQAQQLKQDSTVTFTLKAAQEYALKNSPVIKNANLDVESAKKKIWETTAIGLPQVNSKLAYSYQLTIPDKIKEFSSLSGLGTWMYYSDQYIASHSGGPAFGHIPAPDPNQTTPTDNQMKWGLTYDITVSELLFNASYIVGLQTSKIYKSLSDVGVSKSENDMIELVTNAYYLVLIAEENKGILDSTYINTKKILDFITSLNKEGQNENTDIDQMQLTVSTLKNSLDMITNQVEVAKNLLKFQMGVGIDKKIVLTDNLESLLSSNDLAGLTAKEFKVESNIDYKMSDISVKLSKASLKLQKATLLPDIAAFYNHNWNFNKNSFTFTPPDIIGINMNIPIFGSGLKLAKISEARIALDKAQNLKTLATSGLQTSYFNNKALFTNALNNYTTKKKNVALAEKIYNKNIIKYKEGVIGSLELTLAQNQFLLAQSDYYTSIIDLTTSKSKLEKMFK